MLFAVAGPVVLLHGFAATTFTWRAVAASLAPTHRVVAYDRTEPRWADAAADLVARCGALEAPPVLVGHSAGCVVAVLAVANLGLPVRGMVLVSPVLDGRGPPPFVALLRRLPGFGAALRAGVVVGFARAFRSAWRDTALLTDEVLDGYRAPLLAPGAIDRVLALERAPDVRAQLATIVAAGDVPVAAVVGEHDRWATALSAVSTVVIAGAGHLPHEERPDETIATIGRLVQEMSPGA